MTEDGRSLCGWQLAVFPFELLGSDRCRWASSFPPSLKHVDDRYHPFPLLLQIASRSHPLPATVVPMPPYAASHTARPSTTTNGSFANGKTRARSSQSRFVYRNGSKLHAYGPETLPYSVSYDREVLEL